MAPQASFQLIGTLTMASDACGTYLASGGQRPADQLRFHSSQLAVEHLICLSVPDARECESHVIGVLPVSCKNGVIANHRTAYLPVSYSTTDPQLQRSPYMGSTFGSNAIRIVETDWHSASLQSSELTIQALSPSYAAQVKLTLHLLANPLTTRPSTTCFFSS